MTYSKSEKIGQFLQSMMQYSKTVKPGEPIPITRISQLTGKEHTLEVPITAEQLRRWHAGEHIQTCMSNLTADQREFLMTGITKEEWDTNFKSE